MSKPHFQPQIAISIYEDPTSPAGSVLTARFNDGSFLQVEGQVALALQATFDRISVKKHVDHKAEIISATRNAGIEPVVQEEPEPLAA